MTGLFDAPAAYLGGVGLFLSLAGLGLGIGVLTGLFGVGGGFLITPLLNVLLGIPYDVAVGSSLSLTIGTGASGYRRHLRLGNVEEKTMLILAGGAVCGMALGAMLNEFVRRDLGVRDFTLIMHGLFIAILLLTALLVFRGPAGGPVGRSLLQRVGVGPRIDLPGAGLAGVSLPGMCAAGLVVGAVGGMMGIGGGVLYMPVLLLAVGLSVRQSVGTSLGVVTFGSVAGTVAYCLQGKASLLVVVALLSGSTLGAQTGAYLCQRLHATRIRRYFSLLVVVVVVLLIVDFIRKLGAAH